MVTNVITAVGIAVLVAVWFVLNCPLSPSSNQSVGFGQQYLWAFIIRIGLC